MLSSDSESVNSIPESKTLSEPSKRKVSVSKRKISHTKSPKKAIVAPQIKISTEPDSVAKSSEYTEAETEVSEYSATEDDVESLVDQETLESQGTTPRPSLVDQGIHESQDTTPRPSLSDTESLRAFKQKPKTKSHTNLNQPTEYETKVSNIFIIAVNCRWSFNNAQQ